MPSERRHGGVLSRCQHLLPVEHVGGVLPQVTDRQRLLDLAHACARLSSGWFETSDRNSRGGVEMWLLWCDQCFR